MEYTQRSVSVYYPGSFEGRFHFMYYYLEGPNWGHTQYTLHKLCRQDFEDFWPPPPFVDKFIT